MSSYEKGASGGELVPSDAQGRAEGVVRRLGELAQRGPEMASVVGLLGQLVVDEVERAGEPGRVTLPSEEEKLWASMGADFTDTGALRRAAARRTSAFVHLLERSIQGDVAMAERLGVDRSRVSQRLAERSLYAFELGEERCFPAWQLSGMPQHSLRTVLGALDPGLHPLVVDHWFNTPNVDLPGPDDEPVTPVEWLATGGSPETLVELVPDT
jgi:hypothetical protein